MFHFWRITQFAGGPQAGSVLSPFLYCPGRQLRVLRTRIWAMCAMWPPPRPPPQTSPRESSWSGRTSRLAPKFLSWKLGFYPGFFLNTKLFRSKSIFLRGSHYRDLEACDWNEGLFSKHRIRIPSFFPKECLGVMWKKLKRYEAPFDIKFSRPFPPYYGPRYEKMIIDESSGLLTVGINY